MKYLKLFEKFRDEQRKIEDLSTIDYAYHWVNEGNLFSQIYELPDINTGPYVLRKNPNTGKKVEMPALPKPKFILGSETNEISSGISTAAGVCLTIDPSYVSAGVTGESNICLVFSMKDLLEKFDVLNLTDNSEAEIRIKAIPDWNKLVKKILVVRKVYEVGDSWEDFAYRAVKEWFPEELKTFVETSPGQKSIGKTLEKEFPNKF